MDSLSGKELDSPKPLTDEQRILKIARGSGTSILEVFSLLEEHKRVSKTVERMGKSGLLGKNGGMPDLAALQRNPGQIMKKLQQSMDPQMLSQIGGAQNLMSMMKDFEANPDMAAMMKQMQPQKKRK